MGKNIHKANCLFGAGYLLTQVEAMQSEIQGALVGDDIEHIHQMRVASRRMRNALNLFRECIPEKKRKVWEDEIHKITKSLGKARDLDIQIDRVDQCYAASLEDRYKPGYNRLLLRLKQQRTKTQEKVTRTLVNLQKGDILDRMQAHLTAVTAGAESSYLFTPSLYQQAFEAINRNLEEFLSYENFIHDPQKIGELHAMRIAGKHLRYTLEIFAPIYGNAVDMHVRVMKNVQDLLGEIHDNDVWINWLPKFIDQERARVEDYFGHTGPFRRLLPGLNHFIEDRQRVRDEEYRTFLSTWETLAYENAWTVLKEIIQAPINIEAVLAHVKPQTTSVPDEAQAQDDTPEFEVELTLQDLSDSSNEPLPPIDSVDNSGEET